MASTVCVALPVFRISKVRAEVQPEVHVERIDAIVLPGAAEPAEPKER